jgi:sucrose-6-phosphate hydrolase SacC (GH32 family)
MKSAGNRITKHHSLVSLFTLLCAFLLVNGSFAQPRAQKPEYKKYNPTYHYYPSGDPTGLFYMDGKYYNNWGTAHSTNLIHWKFTPYGREAYRWRLSDSTLSSAERDALLAKMPRLGGSGTIVVDRNNTSGLGENGKPVLVSLWHNDTQPWGNQVIGLAYSNDTAKTWKRFEKFPVLDINNREFRDPMVFWHEPTGRWIMAIGLAEAPKIKFFSSENLKEWTFLSEFGPWGAVGGVWECADFFPLAVDGDPTKMKWVLAISVQPLNGQYFIGDFDGKKFTLDSSFVRNLTYDKYSPPGVVLFDFERGLDNWNMEGDAFLEAPSNATLLGQGAVMGYFGRFYLNSHHKKGQAAGKITSPSFQVTKNYINFLYGGIHDWENQRINLLIDGKIVRSKTGNHSGGLLWNSWNISDYLGKEARIEVVDKGPGFILADQFMLCDDPAKAERERAFWIDYGPDFFAVRSWGNYPENEKRRIWTAWMGSWRYADLEPVRGLQSVPRAVKLKTFPEGVRLVQTPIEELKSIRKVRMTARDLTFEGLWKADKFKPSRNSYEMIAEIENISAEEFGVKIGVGNKQQTIVGYSVKDEEIYVDRRNSGLVDFSGLFPQLNKGPLKNRTKTLKLHIFVDHSSIEVFANDGEATISSKIYPDPTSTGIEFFSSKGSVRLTSVQLWELESIEIDKSLHAAKSLPASK